MPPRPFPSVQLRCMCDRTLTVRVWLYWRCALIRLSVYMPDCGNCIGYPVWVITPISFRTPPSWHIYRISFHCRYYMFNGFFSRQLYCRCAYRDRWNGCACMCRATWRRQKLPVYSTKRWRHYTLRSPPKRWRHRSRESWAAECRSKTAARTTWAKASVITDDNISFSFLIIINVSFKSSFSFQFQIYCSHLLLWGTDFLIYSFVQNHRYRC